MKYEDLKGRLFRIQNDLLIYLATKGIVSNSNIPVIFIGNNYSGYWYPADLVSSQGTLWGVGLGMSSSFEVEMGAQGYKIYGFEPDKRFFEIAQDEFVGIDSEIFPYGLWDKEGRFDSFGNNISLVNIFDNSESNHDSLEIREIHHVANELNLVNQQSPRVLKMNIEGAERDILQSLIERPLPFEVLLFQAEFLLHLRFFKISKKFRATLELRKLLQGLLLADYQLIHVQTNQFTLISVRS
jgi:FkbM family methyltransferase